MPALTDPSFPRRPAVARADEATPVEVIRVLNAVAPRRERSAARPTPMGDAAAKRPGRASVLAAWLRGGGEHAERPPLRERPSRHAAAALEETSREQSAPVAEMRTETRTKTRTKTGIETGIETGTETRTAKTRTVSAAEQLALRIQIFGGEIVEQVYGPSRRWALLDRDGEALETPAPDWVQELIEAGRLSLDRFERGGAVWRLDRRATERRAAYAQKPAPKDGV